MKERPPIWTVAANIFDTYSRIGDKARSLSLNLVEFVTTTHKFLPFYETFSVPSDMD